MNAAGFGWPVTGPLGLPVIVPDSFMVRPAGRLPLPGTRVNVRGATPPVTGILVLYGIPFEAHGISLPVTVPHAGFVIVKVSGCSTVIVAVFVLLVLATEVAVRVTLNVADRPLGAVYVTE